MAGQGVQRRQALRVLSMAAAVAKFPGFRNWTFACGHPRKLLTDIRPTSYQPLFFTPAEYALLDRLVDIIIPADETPGAREAGVSEFIDLMASRDSELQRKFRTGFAWLNATSKHQHDKPFLALESSEQIGLLEPLAYRAKRQPGQQRERDFFALLREYTVMGFYTSEVGLKELNFPGLQFYAESPACPHKDDPEHRHLPPPKW